jgi:hypothetical protein
MSCHGLKTRSGGIPYPRWCDERFVVGAEMMQVSVNGAEKHANDAAALGGP